MSRRRAADAPELDQYDAASVTQSLQEDFSKLIAIFERQFEAGAAGKERLRQISDARATAERGLKLSQELAEILRTTR